MHSINRNLLLIFAKFPQAGWVKTRLGRKIGYERAAQLYRAFLTDLAPRFVEQDGDLAYDIRWVYVPAESRFPELISSIQGDNMALERTSFAAYEATGLLQQQIDQFSWAHQHGYHNVVGVSTDTPHLPRAYIIDAFDKLGEYDVVIGPTCDGGYYLLGTHPYHVIQRNIEMSTDHVTRDIMAVAGDLKLRTYLLPSMLDIDEEQDVTALAQIIDQAGCNPCPATWKVLQEIWGSSR